MPEKTKNIIPISVEIQDKISAKGNEYTVLQVTFELINDSLYTFETFLSNEQKALFAMSK